MSVDMVVVNNMLHCSNVGCHNAGFVFVSGDVRLL